MPFHDELENLVRNTASRIRKGAKGVADSTQIDDQIGNFVSNKANQIRGNLHARAQRTQPANRQRIQLANNVADFTTNVAGEAKNFALSAANRITDDIGAVGNYAGRGVKNYLDTRRLNQRIDTDARTNERQYRQFLDAVERGDTVRAENLKSQFTRRNKRNRQEADRLIGRAEQGSDPKTAISATGRTGLSTLGALNPATSIPAMGIGGILGAGFSAATGDDISEGAGEGFGSGLKFGGLNVLTSPVINPISDVVGQGFARGLTGTGKEPIKAGITWSGLAGRSVAQGGANVLEDIGYNRFVEQRDTPPGEMLLSFLTAGIFTGSSEVLKAVRSGNVEIDGDGYLRNSAGRLFNPENGRWVKEAAGEVVDRAKKAQDEVIEMVGGGKFDSRPARDRLMETPEGMRSKARSRLSPEKRRQLREGGFVKIDEFFPDGRRADEGPLEDTVRARVDELERRIIDDDKVPTRQARIEADTDYLSNKYDYESDFVNGLLRNNSFAQVERAMSYVDESPSSVKSREGYVVDFLKTDGYTTDAQSPTKAFTQEQGSLSGEENLFDIPTYRDGEQIPSRTAAQQSRPGDETVEYLTKLKSGEVQQTMTPEQFSQSVEKSTRDLMARHQSLIQIGSNLSKQRASDIARGLDTPKNSTEKAFLESFDEWRSELAKVEQLEKSGKVRENYFPAITKEQVYQEQLGRLFSSSTIPEVLFDMAHLKPKTKPDFIGSASLEETILFRTKEGVLNAHSPVKMDIDSTKNPKEVFRAHVRDNPEENFDYIKVFGPPEEERQIIDASFRGLGRTEKKSLETTNHVFERIGKAGAPEVELAFKNLRDSQTWYNRHHDEVKSMDPSGYPEFFARLNGRAGDEQYKAQIAQLINNMGPDSAAKAILNLKFIKEPIGNLIDAVSKYEFSDQNTKQFVNRFIDSQTKTKLYEENLINRVTGTALRTASRSHLGLNPVTASKQVLETTKLATLYGPKTTALGYVRAIDPRNNLDERFGLNEFITNYTPRKKGLAKDSVGIADKILFGPLQKMENFKNRVFAASVESKLKDQGLSEKEIVRRVRDSLFNEGNVAHKFNDIELMHDTNLAKAASLYFSFASKNFNLKLNAAEEKQYKRLFKLLVADVASAATVTAVTGYPLLWTFQFLPVDVPVLYDVAKDVYNDVSSLSQANTEGDPEKVRAAQNELIQTGIKNFIPAGTPITRSLEGYSAVNRGFVPTNTGAVKYPVAQTPSNFIKATTIGASSLGETRDYYSEDQRPLGQGDSEILMSQEPGERQDFYQQVLNRRAADRESRIKEKGEPTSLLERIPIPGLFNDPEQQVSAIDTEPVEIPESDTGFNLVYEDALKTINDYEQDLAEIQYLDEHNTPYHKEQAIKELEAEKAKAQEFIERAKSEDPERVLSAQIDTYSKDGPSSILVPDRAEWAAEVIGETESGSEERSGLLEKLYSGGVLTRSVVELLDEEYGITLSAYTSGGQRKSYSGSGSGSGADGISISGLDLTAPSASIPQMRKISIPRRSRSSSSTLDDILSIPDVGKIPVRQADLPQARRIVREE